MAGRSECGGASVRGKEAVPRRPRAGRGVGQEAGPGHPMAVTAGSPLQTGQAAAQEEAIPGAAPGQDRKPDHQPGDHGRPGGG